MPKKNCDKQPAQVGSFSHWNADLFNQLRLEFHRNCDEVSAAVGIMGLRQLSGPANAIARRDWITNLWLSSIRLGRLGDVARELPLKKKKNKVHLYETTFDSFFWGFVYSSVMFSTFICEWHGNSELWINWITTSLFVTSRWMLVFLRGILMNDPQLAMDSKDSRQMTHGA